MDGGLKKLPIAMQLGKHTWHYQGKSLHWARNIIAIPVAAVSYLLQLQAHW